MARAETMESVGETGSGGNCPLPRHNTCHIHTWPSLLPTTAITTGPGTGTDASHLHHNRHHLQPLQALCLSYPLPYPHLEGQDEPQTHQQLPAVLQTPTPPLSPLCNQRELRASGLAVPSALSEEQSGSERGEDGEASSQQGPLPDLLPQNEPPSWPSPHHRAPTGETLHEQEVRRVASQLRAIGDEFNATVLRRAHAVPHWQDWRDACRGLFNFITQTLSALYRLT